MQKFSFSAHTADVRLKVEASTQKELFSAALLGMAQIIKKGFCRKTKAFDATQAISITSLDTTSLLIDFLSAILTYTYEKRAIFCQVEFELFSQNAILAKVFGKKANNFDEDIKAVTYHEAQIIKNQKGLWQTTIVFDI